MAETPYYDPENDAAYCQEVADKAAAIAKAKLLGWFSLPNDNPYTDSQAYLWDDWMIAQRNDTHIPPELLG